MSTVLRLHANEGTPAQDVVRAALARLDPEVVRTYPDAAPLEALLARRLGVEPRRVLVTAGADEALDRACRAFLRPGDEVVAPLPTFSMIPRYVRAAGARLRGPVWWEGPLPVDTLLAVAPRACRAWIVVTPNNPTGAAAARPELERLRRGIGDGMLWLDQAYGEFQTGGPLDEPLRWPRTLVLRTLSKAWGLAGLRVGYAIGPAEWVDALRATASPFGVSGPSLAIATTLLEQGGSSAAARSAEAVRSHLPRLLDALRLCGGAPYPSAANFVLARFSDRAAARALRDALAEANIRVRTFDEPRLLDCVRVTCPADPAEFARLLTVLTVLATQALAGGAA